MSKVQIVGVAEAGRKFKVEELGVEANRQALIAAIADAPKASIIFVKRYESKNGHGQIADYFYLKGVSYESMKQRSLAQLDAIIADDDFSIVVNWNEWFNPETQKKTTAAAKNKELRKNKVTFHAGDHRLLVAIAAIRNSIENPRRRESVYENEGNGVYTQLTDEGLCLHVRDCQQLHKSIVCGGDWPIKASSEAVALKAAISKTLSIGKYRQVRLDGRFDYITVAGQLVMQDGSGEKAFIGFKEHAGLMQTRLPQIDEEIEMEKVIRDATPVIEAFADM